MLISSAIAFGQDDYKKGEFFVGYSNNQVDTGIPSGEIPGNPIDKRESFNGFNASGVVNFSKYFGLKADVSGTYRNDNFGVSVGNGSNSASVSFDADSSLYNVLGGVQVKNNSSERKVKPFAHALVGAGIGRIKVKNINCSVGEVDCNFLNSIGGRETGLAGAFGGGLDIKLSNQIDLRAVQVDYNPIRFDRLTQHNVRIGIGIVFK